MIGRRFSGLATLLALLAVSATQLPASSSWKVGSLYVEERSEYQGDRIVRNTIVDKRGRVELIEIPVCDRRGKWIKDRLLCPDGSPWPYSFPVYGTAALGGIGRVQPDIESILKILPAPTGQKRILQIAFLSAGRVRVQVGWTGTMPEGWYREYELRKVRGRWERSGKVKIYTGPMPFQSLGRRPSAGPISEADIEFILKILPAPVGKERILRIDFLSAGRVHVRVGWSGPGLQGHGYDYEFRKVFGKWKRVPKNSEWFV